jgi:hypothetical protein
VTNGVASGTDSVFSAVTVASDVPEGLSITTELEQAHTNTDTAIVRNRKFNRFDIRIKVKAMVMSGSSRAYSGLPAYQAIKPIVSENSVHMHE